VEREESIKKPNLFKLDFFYGLQITDLKELIQLISHKAYYVNFRKT